MLSCGAQDAEALLRLARRRCADEKAAVRKAAVSLLESLLRLRAAAPARARELPAEADIAAIEAATADPLVLSAAPKQPDLE
jgi:hypothetical protein